MAFAYRLTWHMCLVVFLLVASLPTAEAWPTWEQAMNFCAEATGYARNILPTAASYVWGGIVDAKNFCVEYPFEIVAIIHILAVQYSIILSFTMQDCYTLGKEEFLAAMAAKGEDASSMWFTAQSWKEGCNVCLTGSRPYQIQALPLPWWSRLYAWVAYYVQLVVAYIMSAFASALQTIDAAYQKLPTGTLFMVELLLCVLILYYLWTTLVPKKGEEGHWIGSLLFGIEDEEEGGGGGAGALTGIVVTGGPGDSDQLQQQQQQQQQLPLLPFLQDLWGRPYPRPPLPTQELTTNITTTTAAAAATAATISPPHKSPFPSPSKDTPVAV